MMWDVFTLGAGEYLIDIFNAVAALTSGNDYADLLALSVMFALAWVAISVTFQGNDLVTMGKWMMASMLIYNALFLPKTSVRIVDRLNPALANPVISNVPLGLAMFAGLASDMGDGVTRLTETAFALPNDLRYQENGMLFGASLVEETTRFRITNPVFAQNIQSYMQQCVFYDILLGHLDFADLRYADDIWAVLAVRQSPARSFDYRERTSTGNVTRRLLTCDIGFANLQADWTAELAAAGEYYGERIFSGQAAAVARGTLLASLPVAQNYLIGSSQTAANSIRHQMLVNAFIDAGENFGARAGNLAVARSYAEVRSRSEALQSYQQTGLQAGRWVPLLRGVFEMLYYGMFPFAFLLLMTPLWQMVFKGYFGGFVWLQSWRPMFAILNRVMMGQAESGMSSQCPDGITMACQYGLQQVSAELAVMGGYLSMSIPFLAGGLMFGANRLMGLATSMLAVPQRAIGHAVHETATGNMSLGNTSFDNHSFYNMSGFQMRTAPHVQAVGHSIMAHDGGELRVTGSGEQVYDQTRAISSTGYDVGLSRHVGEETAEQMAQEQALAEGMRTEISESTASTYASTADYYNAVSRAASSGSGASSTLSASEAQMADRFNEAADQVSQRTGFTRENSLAFLAHLGAGGDGKIWKLPVSAGGKIEFRGQTLSREQFEEAQNYVDTNKIGEMFRQGADMARTSSYNLNDSETRGYREAINASLSETQSLTEQRDVHLSNIERLSETQRAFTSESVEGRQNLNQAFKNFVAEHEMQPGASRALFVRASQGDGGARQQLDEYRDRFIDGLVISSLGTDGRGLSGGFSQASQKMKNDANIGEDYASDRTGIIGQGQAEAPGTDPTPVIRATHWLANRASEETGGNKERLQTASQKAEDTRGKAGDNALQGADEWITGGRAGDFLIRRGLGEGALRNARIEGNDK